ncbi:MAG: energy-coupling factor transporter transmembrane protein EcfT [Anaerolineae bacterium]|nr:energy-coupling factor transporter transmembrane protein EcfT [Anaerolineae bacterium]
MLVTWKYRPRDSFVEKADPRARWIFSFLVLFALTLFWDIRLLLFFLAIVVAQYILAKVTWEETRRAWIFILVFVVGIVALNTLFTGRGGPAEVLGAGHVLWRAEWRILGLNIHPTITVERVWFAVSQVVRMLSISGLFLIVPYTMNPRHYGVTFRRIGVPDRFAFSMDLAFRFVPTLARDFNTTLDAQKARGYEVEKLEGGIIAQIRKMAPLVVPVTMNAILSGEDITNAMDLRCFGTEPRTWIHELTYKRWDYVLIGVSILVFVASLVVRYGFRIGTFWVPDWALAWGIVS